MSQNTSLHCLGSIRPWGPPETKETKQRSTSASAALHLAPRLSLLTAPTPSARCSIHQLTDDLPHPYAALGPHPGALQLVVKLLDWSILIHSPSSPSILPEWGHRRLLSPLHQNHSPSHHRPPTADGTSILSLPLALLTVAFKCH